MKIKNLKKLEVEKSQQLKEGHIKKFQDNSQKNDLKKSSSTKSFKIARGNQSSGFLYSDCSEDSITAETSQLNCRTTIPIKSRNKSEHKNLYAYLKIDNKDYYLTTGTGSNTNKFISNEENVSPVYSKSALASPQEHALRSRRTRKNQLSICVSQTRYNLVGKVAKSLGWRVFRYTGHWNVLWVDSDPGVEVFKDMKRFQKINHFPGMHEICRKDLLARNLGRLLKLFPDEYNFFPKTWCFPADYGEALSYNKKHRNKTFILKPDSGAQGRGIFLTKHLKDNVKPTERLICQVYINRPLLIDGYKFDLRVYTLITTVDPLRVFVYSEGLVRLATSKYRDPSDSNVSDLFMHLTNYSVNKRNDNFCHDAKSGSKRKFSSLHRSLIKEGYDIDTLWRNIDDTIIKTILSSWPVLRHNYTACFPSHDVMQACFEILGFDILVDSNLKPYILEVNQSPSFYTDEPVDMEVKESLIKDTLNLLNISLVNKTKIINEDKKRIKMRLLKRTKQNMLKEVLSRDNITEPSTISPLGQQIAWEESHLGGFRRIMPVHTDHHRYSYLIQLQNQSSIFAETVASKRREEASKELRVALIEREKQKQALLPSLKNDTGRKSSPPSSLNKKKKYCPLKKDWSSCCILNDIEERERKALLSQREDIIRNSGLFEEIFESFHQMKILSDSDRKKYKDFYLSLEEEQKEELQRRKISAVYLSLEEEQKELRRRKISANIQNIKILNCIQSKSKRSPPLPLVTMNNVVGKFYR